MVKKHALLLGLAILAELSVFLLAVDQFHPLVVSLTLVVLSAAAGLLILPGVQPGLAGATVSVAPVRPFLFPRVFRLGATGWNIAASSTATSLTSPKPEKNPEQESVDDVVRACARVRDVSRRQP